MIELTLLWLAQNYAEKGWPVRYSIEASFTVGVTPVATALEGSASESELAALAAARGASTWDESDVIAHFSGKHGGADVVVKPVDQSEKGK